MSRIGNKLIKVPTGLTVTINDNFVDIKGAKGEDKVSYDKELVGIELNDGIIKVTRANEEKHTKQLHGTTRALLNNAIVGCSEGFKKDLEIIGIGYHAEIKNNAIVLSVGYSHPITIEPLPGVTITCTDATHVSVSGNDKFKVGQVAAQIRETRKPEPYQGKGIKYKGEFIARKEGKRAGATGGSK